MFNHVMVTKLIYITNWIGYIRVHRIDMIADTCQTVFQLVFTIDNVINVMMYCAITTNI